MRTIGLAAAVLTLGSCGRRDGNVVYEAGREQQISFETGLPPGVTVRKIRRLAEATSERMRIEIEDCLAKARLGVRKRPPPQPTPSQPAPAIS